MSTPADVTSSTTENTLAAVAAQASAPIAMGGNRPVLLIDPNQVLVVIDGAVDLFSVPVKDNAVAGAREFIGQVTAGGLLMGIAQVAADATQTFAVLAVGTVNTTISKLDRAWLTTVQADPALQAELAAGIDAWLSALSGVFVEDVPPSTAVSLEAGNTVTLRAGADAVPGARVVWMRTETGSVQIGGDATQPALPADNWFPLAQLDSTSDVWIRASAAATLHVCSTLDLIRTAALASALAAFQPILASGIQRRHLAILADAQAQLAERTALVQTKITAAAHELAQAMRLPHRSKVSAPAVAPAIPAADGSALLTACQLVGDTLGIVFSPPTQAERVLANRDPLSQITFASRIRSRRVRLDLRLVARGQRSAARLLQRWLAGGLAAPLHLQLRRRRPAHPAAHAHRCRLRRKAAGRCLHLLPPAPRRTGDHRRYDPFLPARSG
ncbi:MAG: hypothetical protein V9G19_10670 [Tetrasphaera sp.]